MPCPVCGRDMCMGFFQDRVVEMCLWCELYQFLE